MARSKYIYTLYNGRAPLAHFTVKYEAVRYWRMKLGRNPSITLERSPDGGSTEKSVIVRDWQTPDE